jgi:phage baseplate assembly protein W
MATSATWPLAPTPTPSPPSPGGVSGVGQSTIPAGIRVYLGHCVIRPLRRDRKNDYAHDGGVALVAAAVVQVLGTICDTGVTRGELPWRTDFGSAIELLRFKNIDESLESLADLYVFEALQRWEPRAIVRRTQMASEERDGVGHVVLRVVFDVATSNTPGSEIVARDLVAERWWLAAA